MSDPNVPAGPAKAAAWRWPTAGEVGSLVRYVSTAAGSVIAALVALHVFTGDQAQSVTKALNDIGNASTIIVGAAGSLIAVGSAVYGVMKSSPWSRLLSTANNPDVARVVMKDPAVAQAIPNEKVTPS